MLASGAQTSDARDQDEDQDQAQRLRQAAALLELVYLVQNAPQGTWQPDQQVAKWATLIDKS